MKLFVDKPKQYDGIFSLIKLFVIKMLIIINHIKCSIIIDMFTTLTVYLWAVTY